MVFAMLLRSPRSGRTSSWASGSGRSGGAWTGARVLFSACARTSAFITLPWGPEPWSAPRSTPISRAMRRVTGVARTFRPSPLPACALVCAPCADAPACGCGRLAVCRGAGCPACSAERLGAACDAAPETAAAGDAPAPSTSRTIRVECTFAISPSLPTVFTTLPRRGLGMVTVALSVITSTSGWSSTIWSPAFTSHLTISPSTTPSPMSGSLNSNWDMSGLVGFQLAQRLQDPRRERQVVVFQRVRERRIPAGDAGDGGLRVAEAALLDERADLRRKATSSRRLLHDGAAAGLADAARDGLDVQRPERSEVDELRVELRSLLHRLQRLVEHGAPGDHRHAPTFAGDLRLADGDGVLAFRHFPFRRPVDALRLHEDDRVVLADGRDQKALRVEGIGRAHDLEPRRVDEERLRRLRVVVAALDPASHRRADHHRRAVLAPAAVPQLGELVHDLIERREDEVRELDLRDRAQSVHRHPDRRTDDSRLGQRRVDHALGPELLDQTHGGAEHPTELPHVLAHHYHARIAAHLDPQGVIDGLNDVPGWHPLPAVLDPALDEVLAGLVAGADQRPGGDEPEAEREALPLELREHLRPDELLHRQVLLRRPEVLPQREDVAAGRAQVAHRLQHFAARLAQPEHDAALRAHATALVELEHLEGLAVCGAPVAHPRRQALHRLEIMRRDRGLGVDDHLQRIARALEIRRQHLHQRPRRRPAELDDGLGEVRGASVRQLVPVHRGDHQVIEAQLAYRLGKVTRLQRIERPGDPAVHVTEAATPGADVPHQHHGGGAAAPAFADVRTARLFTDGVEVQLAQGALDVLVPAAARHAHLEPLRLGLAPRARPTAELDQRVGHEGGGITESGPDCEGALRSRC